MISEAFNEKESKTRETRMAELNMLLAGQEGDNQEWAWDGEQYHNFAWEGALVGVLSFHFCCKLELLGYGWFLKMGAVVRSDREDFNLHEFPDI